ncbi:family 1 glycosylhydrolase [Actinosynnema sp. CS-041913]|uniref:family 1 glycosylhydrolase n=1 Tax=Actinosynnema sp. CS-041913 TaxID=3239917 RepID=UPI003D93A018
MNGDLGEEGGVERFGIAHVDYETRLRTPKMRSMWYSQVAAGNAPAAMAAS